MKQAYFASNKYQPNTKHPKPNQHYQAAIDLHAMIVEADARLAEWFDGGVTATSIKLLFR